MTLSTGVRDEAGFVTRGMSPVVVSMDEGVLLAEGHAGMATTAPMSRCRRRGRVGQLMHSKNTGFLLLPLTMISLATACDSQPEAVGGGAVRRPDVTLPALPGRPRTLDPDSDFELVVTRSGERLVDGRVVDDEELRSRLLEWRQRSGLGVFDAPGGRMEVAPDTLQPCELILRADHRLDLEHFRELVKLLVAEPLWIYDFCFACAPIEGQDEEVQRVVPCSLEGGHYWKGGGQTSVMPVQLHRTQPASGESWAWAEDQLELVFTRRQERKLEEGDDERGSRLDFLSEILRGFHGPASWVIVRPSNGTLLADFVRVVERVNRGSRREIAYESVGGWLVSLAELLEDLDPPVVLSEDGETNYAHTGYFEEGVSVAENDTYGRFLDVSFRLFGRPEPTDPHASRPDMEVRRRGERVVVSYARGGDFPSFELSIVEGTAGPRDLRISGHDHGTVLPRDHVTVDRDGVVRVNGVRRPGR